MNIRFDSALEKLYELGFKASMLRVYGVLTNIEYKTITEIIDAKIVGIMKQKFEE